MVTSSILIQHKSDNYGLVVAHGSRESLQSNLHKFVAVFGDKYDVSIQDVEAEDTEETGDVFSI